MTTTEFNRLKTKEKITCLKRLRQQVIKENALTERLRKSREQVVFFEEEPGSLKGKTFSFIKNLKEKLTHFSL